ncbi:LOW QUALITY PROTEIN: hypothetical protein V2J09_019695 [Rumex salicifolius]
MGEKGTRMLYDVVLAFFSTVICLARSPDLQTPKLSLFHRRIPPSNSLSLRTTNSQPSERISFPFSRTRLIRVTPDAATGAFSLAGNALAMSNAGADDSTGEEDEVEEERDCFYESLDRILSSSNSSTPASEDEEFVFNSPSHGRHSFCHAHPTSIDSRTGKPCTKFPIPVQNYDEWISDAAFSSSSLQQRRDRLLCTLGLSSDATVSRRKNSFSDYGIDFARSVSAVHLSTNIRSSRIHPHSSNFSMVRSKTETSTRKSTSTSTILSIHSLSDKSVNSNDSIHVDVRNVVVDNLPNEGLACLNKLGDRAAEIQSNASHFGSGSNCDVLTDDVGSCTKGVDCSETGEGSADMYVIKNLDTGKEFMVNEVREDEMKLREVGTGRQLTMEEFEMCVGHSPIVQELMRRQNVVEQTKESSDANRNGNVDNGGKPKKKVSWLKSIKNVASGVTGRKDRRISDERDASPGNGGRSSVSATDDSQDVSFHGPERVRIRQYGKSVKELSALYKNQDIQAHNGPIWSMKFSLDGKYLASAGEDCVIHVWEVLESERKGELLRDRPEDSSSSQFYITDGSPGPNSLPLDLESSLERKRRGRTSISRKSMSLDHIVIPENVFGLSEKPVCSFHGHLDDVLDLSWSKSQLLLSSSMDKTVRLWDLSSKTCLNVFSHNDYVTCIQFNPVDDRYFISGSLDAKVRIWSIPDRQVVDWNDLHEMVTAACYTPDGQGALVGSYKGSCRLYNTTENKLQPKSRINLQNKKKKAHLKKITGFQFAPGSSSEVLITSADSRIRVADGVDLIHKFKGFKNSNSQISASITPSGKDVVCASEDSHVFIWKHEGKSRPSRSKDVTVTRSYEYFHCQDVSVAIPWPGNGGSSELTNPFSRDEPKTSCQYMVDETLTNNHPSTTQVEDSNGIPGPSSTSMNSCLFDRLPTSWAEEKFLLARKSHCSRPSLDSTAGIFRNSLGNGHCDCKLERENHNIPELWVACSDIKPLLIEPGDSYRVSTQSSVHRTTHRPSLFAARRTPLSPSSACSAQHAIADVGLSCQKVN